MMKTLGNTFGKPIGKTVAPLAAALLLSWPSTGALGAGQAAAGAPTRRPLSPDDFYRSAEVADLECSPDGAWVAYVVTNNDRDADESRSAVWMVSWDGSQRLPLTNAANGTRSPHWSPDGRYLAYIAVPAGSDKGQIMVLDRRGGDARPLTIGAEEISDYRWSPDGKRLVLVVQKSGEEAAEGAKRAAAAKIPKPIVIDALHFKEDEEGYLAAGDGQHLMLFDIEAKKLEALTADPGFNEDLPVWSPDGRRIAFVRTHAKGPDADGREEIDVIDAHPGAAPQTLSRPYAPNQQTLAWSPDGSLLAYLQGLEPKYNAYMQDRLVIVPAAGGTPRTLGDALDRAVMAYAFAADSASITVAVEDDGSEYPASVDLRSGKITRLTDAGPSVVSAVSIAGGHTAVLYSNDTAAAEIYALEAGKLRKLTAHNDALLAELQLGAVEDLRFHSKDGTDVHGLLVKPPGFVPGKKYPLILWIHGGPNGQDQHSFAFDEYQYKRQLLAAGGYVVIGINYRGSSGRGIRFAEAIFADWGHKEVEDLLAGVDRVVAAGLADPTRIGIGGWSYGGILTDYSIASDRRFKAAVSGAGSANQLSMYGGDEYILQYNSELGAPWQHPDLWLKVSYPFFHADRIHTPTLFMGGDKDFNVPIVGGEQMYEALRTLGVPTELIVYPGEYHALKRPSFLQDRAQRIADWYARYLR
jgi:dipeptidyl aminopeptidase/acylaminoacyl peptidase